MMASAMANSSALSGARLRSSSRTTQQQPRMVVTQAFWKKKEPEVAPAKGGKGSKFGKAKEKAAPPQKRKQSFLEALDFSDTRSYEDAKLLSDAKYGKRKDGKMTREQYAALRRKIGGTSKDFFKEWVDVQGDYVERGYVGESNALKGGVPGLPFLIAVVIALIGTTGYIATVM